MTRSWSKFGLLVVALCSALATACGPGKEGETPAGNERDEERAAHVLAKARETKDIESYRRLVSRFPDSRAAGEGREELATLLIEQAEKSLKEDDFSTADDRAEESTLYAGLDLTEKARALQKRVDEGRAARIAKKSDQAANEGRCASALKLVAVPLREKPRAHFKEELMSKAEAGLVGCLTKKLEAEAKAGNVEAARALVTSPDTTTALGKEAYGKTQAALRKVLVQQSLGEVKPLLDASKWKEAFAKLDEMKAAGKLSQDELPVAQGVVREAIAAHVLAATKAAVAGKKPADAAKDIEASIQAAGWEKVPDEVGAALSTLATAVECARLKCKLGTPSSAWSWGAISIHPANNAAAAESGSLKHAQKVWVLGKGGPSTLIAVDDPGAAEGVALYDKAAGWVDAKNLKPTDTALWLPPDNQLTDVLVWAPLRAPSKDYHLGTVKKVAGRKATVERMQDKAEVVVDLGSLRVGTLDKGLKVMAFCVDKVHTESAKVDNVVASDGGIPKVKIVCDKGDLQRVEIGSALVTKAEWLPPKKP